MLLLARAARLLDGRPLLRPTALRDHALHADRHRHHDRRAREPRPGRRRRLSCTCCVPSIYLAASLIKVDVFLSLQKYLYLGVLGVRGRRDLSTFDPRPGRRGGPCTLANVGLCPLSVSGHVQALSQSGHSGHRVQGSNPVCYPVFSGFIGRWAEGRCVGHFSRLCAHLLQEHFSIYDPMQRTSFQQLLPPRVAAWRLGLGGVVGARCRWARRARGAGRTHTRHPTPHTPTRHCDGVRCGSKYFLLLTNIIPQKPTQSLRGSSLRTTARTSRVHMQA